MDAKRESFRVSGFILFKRNLFDLTLIILVVLSYIATRLLISKNSSFLTFILVFSCLFLSINYHIESYRAFVSIRKTVKSLSKDEKLRKSFLSVHLGYSSKHKAAHHGYTFHESVNRETSKSNNKADSNRGKIFSPQSKAAHGESSLDYKWTKWSPSQDAQELFDIKTTDRGDSFNWMNKIITFFWPYLSHVIHYELNEFFRDQIDSGSLARSNEELKRLVYAILRQLDTNILVIEKCQLGHQAPFIKELSISEETSRFLGDKKSDRVKVAKATDTNNAKGSNNLDQSKGKIFKSIQIDSNKQNQLNSKSSKFLVYNVDLEYNGDMNIAVIYKYFCCFSSRFGLKDVFLHFKLRFVLGPIEANIPFIDRVSFTLLELPQFGYKGIALAELAELKVVRGVINRLITKNLLYPRSASVSLHELLDTLINGPKTRKQRIALKRLQEEKERQEAERKEAEKNLIANAGSAEVSFWTRFAANALLFGCMCSNLLLQTCQSTRTSIVEELKTKEGAKKEIGDTKRRHSQRQPKLLQTKSRPL